MAVPTTSLSSAIMPMTTTFLPDDDAFNSTVDPNVTDPCPKPRYIPTVDEYKEALGGYGIAFVTIGSVTTALLYLLFFQQMWFTFSNTHKSYRRHIYWLISIYPFVTLMSTLSLVVPRAHQICSAVKVTYMSIGVGHFADLTILMYGSENKMIFDVANTPMKLNLLPFCCVCPCLPSPPTSKLRISLLKWMVWQLKWTQALYFITRYLISVSLQDTQGTVTSSSTFIWLTILNFASFLSGVYALNIMSALSFEHLSRFRYRAKSMAVKLLILTIKLQGFLFDVLGNSNLFPCLGPAITPVVYQNTLENSVFLVEMVVFGLFSYFMYRRMEFKEPPAELVMLGSDGKTISSPAMGQGTELSNQQGKGESSSNGSGESAYGSTVSGATTVKNKEILV